jgi:hypothetical protein
MPTSTSAKRSTNSGRPTSGPRSTGTTRSANGKRSTQEGPPERASLIKPLILVVVLAVIVVTLVALPASMVRRFLPPTITADDFSGTLWHGSAGSVTLNSRKLGAVEWHLHPAALLHMHASADVHWVKVGFVADGTADADSKSVTLTHLQGGGPLDDIADLGLGHGWRGTTSFNFSEIKLALGTGDPKLVSAVGDLSVANLTSPMVADGADIGGYTLHLANGAITPDSDASAELSDTGGPLELQATIHLSSGGHTGMLSGTVRERPGAPASLHRDLEQLAQLHPRDASGRIPVDLEFTL